MIVEKWSEHAKLIVRIVAICAIIAVLVTLVLFLTGAFKSGAGRMGDEVISVAKSVYDNYDDKNVDGTAVMSAIKSYCESNMAIIVANAYTEGDTFSFDPLIAPNYGVLADQEHNGGHTISTTSGPVPTAKVSYDEKNLRWYLGEKGSKGKYGLDYSGDTWLRNKNYKAMSDTQAPDCYVSTGAKWRANLLYDPQSDTVCGILFRQIP